MIKKFREITYTDDGCTRYECLWCKASWEGRYFPTVYCGNCGIKFEGEIKVEEPVYSAADYEKQDAVNKAAKDRRNKQARWIIEARQFRDGVLDLEFGYGKKEWAIVFDSDDGHGPMNMTGREVLALLRRFRAMSRYHNEMRSAFKNSDGTLWTRQEFRPRMTAERDIGAPRYSLGYPYDVEYYERLAREDDEQHKPKPERKNE